MPASTLKLIFSPRMLAVFLLGISSGLPLLLIGGTLKAWMSDAGVELGLIGVFSLVGLPYTLKFAWAPLMDRFTPPLLGRRRGWIVVWQVALILGLSALAFSDPGAAPGVTALIAFACAFFSASQDIAIDAWRRDALPDNELGLGSSLAVNGYRVGMLLASAVALSLADHISWREVYLGMAAIMGLGIVATFMAPDPEITGEAPKTLREAVIEPFVDFFASRGMREALVVLAFILLYKIGDAMAAEILNPFYLDIGFTKTQIGAVAKLFGFWALIVGGLLGGVLMLRMGINRALWVFGVLQAGSTACFAALAALGPQVWGLAAVVTVENLAAGMGTSAYVAYMARLCDRRFTATQYALLTSLMGVPRVILGSTTGFLAEAMGWAGFFIFCTAIALPGMAMLVRVAPWGADDDQVSER